MNWKNVPHLFANGKFKVRSELPSMPVGEVECILHGYTNGQYRLQFSGIFDWVDVADCQLIARKIEDMDGDEYTNAVRKAGLDVQRVQEAPRDFVLSAITGTTDSFLYLLSIGIYPFPDTEDVIFITNLEADH